MTSTLLTETESVIVTRDGAPRTLVSSVERVVVRDELGETVHRDEQTVVVAEGAPADLDDFAGIGTRGLVPDPGSGSATRVLRSDGTWGAQSGGGGGASDAVDVTFTPAGGISATDVQAAIEELDAEKASTGALASGLAGKADVAHSHAISDVTGLAAALAAADQVAADVPFTPAGSLASTDVQEAIEELDAEKAALAHTHAISNVTGLQTALDGKSNVGHGHGIADVTGLQTALDGKAATVHGHAISDVTGLTSALAAKLESPVENVSLADVATATIKGRLTAGTGDVEDLTAAQARSVLNVADGANAYSHPNHTGDVTSSGDGATTIAANAVTNAQLAHVATAIVKGRTTAGTGDVEDVTIAALGGMLGSVQTLRLGTNQSFSTTTFTVILDWDDTSLNPAWCTYDAATGEFTVVQKAHVKIDVSISLVLAAAGNAQFQMEVAEETAPGVYARLDNFLVTQDVATTRDGGANAHMHMAWVARAGFVFVLRARRASGAAQIDTKLAWSWLTIDTRLTP